MAAQPYTLIALDDAGIARSRLVRDARALMEEYAASLPYSLCFQGFHAEMAELPGLYQPPSGQLIVAHDDGSPVGCIALRPLPPERGGGPLSAGTCCEMKRLWVTPSARGSGLGRTLCERIIEDARRRGYARMRLDTDERDMASAITLYERLGFRQIQAYNDDPLPGTRWYELSLR
jgi:putative acetyltransferase